MSVVVLPVDDLAPRDRHDDLVQLHAGSGHDDEPHLALDGIARLPAREVVLVGLVQHDVREQRRLGDATRRAHDLDRALDLVAGQHLERMRDGLHATPSESARAHEAKRLRRNARPATPRSPRSSSPSPAPSSPMASGSGSWLLWHSNASILRSTAVGDVDVVREAGRARAEPRLRHGPRLVAFLLELGMRPPVARRRGTPRRAPPSPPRGDRGGCRRCGRG